MNNNLTEKIRRRYDRYSKFYDLLEAPMELSIGKLRKKIFGKLEGRILEVGVGTGKNLKYYSPKAKVTGIDFSEGMLQKAASKKPANVTLAAMDVQNLALSEHNFDYVVTSFVFCSVPDPVLGLKQLRKELKLNGRMIMIEHVKSNIFPLSFLMELFNPVLVGLFGFNINRRTRENILKAGWQIESERSIFLDILKVFVLKTPNGNDS